MSDEQPPEIPKEIPVRYENSRDHRVVHADGVITSVTPNLEIQARFYETVMPMPLPGVLPVSHGGEIQEPESVAMPPEIVRQVNVSVVLNPVTIIRIIQAWSQILERLKTTGNERVRTAIEQTEASKV